MKNFIKKITIIALGMVAFLEVSLLLLYLIYAPDWLKALVDFRPRPPYLPISAPFAADQAPHMTTAYFVVPEDDLLVTLFLRYKYAQKNYDNLRNELEKNSLRWEKNLATGRWEPPLINESDIHQQLKIELWTVRNGREESVFSGSAINPEISSLGTGNIRSTVVVFPVPLKKNEIYRLQVTNSQASPALVSLSEVEIYVCQGCQGK